MQRPLLIPLPSLLSDLLRLAVPVIIARTGIMTMALTGTLFVGHYGVTDLGYLSIGNAAITTVIVASMGLLFGTLVMTAQASGGGDYAECGRVWRRSLPYAFLIGVGGVMLGLLAEPFLLLTGQTPKLAMEGARVALILALGVPFSLMHVVCSSFLEAINRPMPGMVIMLGANLLNIFLNWILVFGALGFPEMGAVGSACASVLARACALVVIALFIWNMAEQKKFAVRERLPQGWLRHWPEWRTQRRLGFAQGASNGIEAGTFNGLALIAGLLGPVPLAAYAILFNIIAMAFMIPLGLANATAIRVGAAFGANDKRGATAIGWLGLGVCICVLSPIGVTMAAIPDAFAAAYSANAVLIAAAAPLIAFGGWLIVADGCQVIMAHALRGRGDGWTPAVMHLFSYVAVMLPAGYILALPMARGAMGLVEAVLLASLISAALLAGRFGYLARQDATTA